MSRGAPRGRGGNAVRGSNAYPLQGLEDIDLELELLKRKRELIAEQQQMLFANQQQSNSQSNNYEQYNPNFNSNHDYSYLYEDPRGSRAGRKRPAIPVWEDEFPAKRAFLSRRGNVKKTFGSRLGPEPNPRSQTNRQSFIQPWEQSGPITNHRPRTFPKKPISQSSIAKRNSNVHKESKGTKLIDAFVNLSRNSAAKLKVTAATSSVANNKAGSSKSALVLRADETPTPQLTGRLELALGMLFKKVKEAYEPRYNDLFAGQYARIMKQTIRERINTVMLGKIVGNPNEIVNAYRVSFSEESDKDIVDAALAAKSGPKLLMTPKDSDDPEEYFKSNMHRLINIKLQEMFKKLEEIYRFEYSKQNESRPDDSVSDLNNKVNATDDVTKHVEKDKDEPSFSIPVKYDFVEKMMKKKFPGLLKAHIPSIIKLMRLDIVFTNTEAAIRKGTFNKLSPEQTDYQIKDEPTSDNQVAAKPTKSKRPVARLPYYVKILSRPSMPEKESMQDFLRPFNPKAIKKHKSIKNLLFVGFDKKEDFENILAATESYIGSVKLDIRVSETTNDKSDEPHADNAEIRVEIKTESSSFDDKLFSPDLDNQITDLLSSIRKADEQEKIEHESNLSEKPIEIEADNAEAVSANMKTNEINISEKINEVKTDCSEVSSQDENTTSDETSQSNNIDTEVTAEIEETRNEDVEMQDGTKTCEEIKINTDKIIEINETSESETMETNESDKTEDDQKKDQKSAPNLDTENLQKLETIEETPEGEKIKTERMEALKSEVKESGRATPTRSSSRLAAFTPSSIKTRRASRLAQNNSS